MGAKTRHFQKLPIRSTYYCEQVTKVMDNKDKLVTSQSSLAHSVGSSQTRLLPCSTQSALAIVIKPLTPSVNLRDPFEESALERCDKTSSEGTPGCYGHSNRAGLKGTSTEQTRFLLFNSCSLRGPAVCGHVLQRMKLSPLPQLCAATY